MFKCSSCNKFAPTLHDAMLCESKCYRRSETIKLERRIADLERKAMAAPVSDGQVYSSILLQLQLKLIRLNS